MVDYLSESLEDYLEAIYHIATAKGAAKAKDIAQRLNVNSSSVTGALRALAKKDLVNYAPYDLITLTDEGNKIAHQIVYKHETLKKFLLTVLQVNPSEAEENACRMEHAISPTVFDRFVEFIRFVETCPMGGGKWIKEKGFRCIIDKENRIEVCNNCGNLIED